VNVEKLTTALDILTEVYENFIRMPEEREKAVEAALHIQITQMYLVEIASLIANGMDPYDAMLHAAKGDLPFDGGGPLVDTTAA